MADPAAEGPDDDASYPAFVRTADELETRIGSSAAEPASDRQREETLVSNDTTTNVHISPTFDHIAFTVPNLDEQVERLAGDLGMEVQLRSEHFAVVVDPASGLKLELSSSDDGEVHLRHLGFRADDVDTAHATLVAAGMKASTAPHRRDFAGMYTSFLEQLGGVEVQLVKYD